MDDTHNNVLTLVRQIEAEQQEAIQNGKNPASVRSGIHTTNVTKVFPKGEIVLYKTGLHHSGEIIAQLLSFTPFCLPQKRITSILLNI